MKDHSKGPEGRHLHIVRDENKSDETERVKVETDAVGDVAESVVSEFRIVLDPKFTDEQVRLFMEELRKELEKRCDQIQIVDGSGAEVERPKPNLRLVESETEEE